VHEDFLKGSLRVDVFAVKEGGVIDGRLMAPLAADRSGVAPGAAVSD